LIRASLILDCAGKAQRRRRFRAHDTKTSKRKPYSARAAWSFTSLRNLKPGAIRFGCRAEANALALNHEIRTLGIIYFLIRDNGSGSILFLGRIIDPTK
jgi:hypothetical protein